MADARTRLEDAWRHFLFAEEFSSSHSGPGVGGSRASKARRWLNVFLKRQEANSFKKFSKSIYSLSFSTENFEFRSVVIKTGCFCVLAGIYRSLSLSLSRWSSTPTDELLRLSREDSMRLCLFYMKELRALCGTENGHGLDAFLLGGCGHGVLDLLDQTYRRAGDAIWWNAEFVDLLLGLYQVTWSIYSTYLSIILHTHTYTAY